MKKTAAGLKKESVASWRWLRKALLWWLQKSRSGVACGTEGCWS